MIDSHCHIDQYEDPGSVAQACESARIITVAVTSLPSHYKMALPHLDGNAYVHAALGFHPLLAAKHAREVSLFESLCKQCHYIGEIGIDGSKQGISTIESQRHVFDRVVGAIADRRRFVTIHSRGAVREVINCLKSHLMYPVVFHWFSGSISELSMVLDAGHYLSFNPAMTESAKWQDVIHKVPLNRILTETDGPYSKVSGRPCKPQDVANVIDWLSVKLGMTRDKIEEEIIANYEMVRGEESCE